jgi:serine/threonine protein kinase
MAAPTQLSVADLGQITKLASGGTAVVYRVPNLRKVGISSGSYVYKKYNDKTKQLAGPALGSGLTNFVQFRDRLPPDQLRAWDDRIIWPIAVVTDAAGAADGIVMRLIPDRFFQNFQKRAGGVDRKPREIESLFGDLETARRVGLPDVSLVTRLQIIRAIAGAYAMMHKEGIVLGDISGRNIIYDPDAKQPAIMVVDVDSARIRGNRSTFGSQPHTPNWQPPEAMAASAEIMRLKRSQATVSNDVLDRLQNTWSIQSVKTDVYKFGLMVVRILDFGKGCAVNRDPAKARKMLQNRLGDQAAVLLDASLSAKPADRPEMREWYRLFQGGTPGKSSTGSVPVQGSTKTKKATASLQNGLVKGNWQWVEGTGWVRIGRS